MCQAGVGNAVPSMRRLISRRLREKSDASAEERQRVADILLRAAEEIRKR
jgi:hypothetical protein